MKEWTWKNWLGLAAVVFGVWLVFYIVEWNSRYGASKYWGDAFVSWWGDIVMLHWVERYQTLLGGLLAFGAGAFVYVTARAQRQDQIADRNAAWRQQRIGQLTEASRLLLAIGGAVRYTAPPNSLLPGMGSTVDPGIIAQLRDNLAELRPVLANISPFAPLVSQTVGAISEQVRVKVEAAASPMAGWEARGELNWALATASWAGSFLQNPARLIEADGTYRHRKEKWQRDNAGIDPLLRPFFERD